MPGFDWHGVDERRRGTWKYVVFSVVTMVALVAGLLLLLGWMGSSTRKQVTERFCQAVLAADAEALMAIMDPDLRSRIDEPVLRAWLEEARRAEAIRQGQIPFDVQIAGREITDLDPRSGPMDTWKAHPVVEDALPEAERYVLYQKQATKFLRNYYRHSPEMALAALPQEEQEDSRRSAFLRECQTRRQRLGAFEEERLQRTRLDRSADPVVLELVYEVKGSRGETVTERQQVRLTFAFKGFRGRLIRADFTTL